MRDSSAQIPLPRAVLMKGADSTTTATSSPTSWPSRLRTSSSAKLLQAVDPRAIDRIDVLTVVKHEFGHELGLSDLASSVDDLMSRTLSAGVRCNPTEADATFADHGSWM